MQRHGCLSSSITNSTPMPTPPKKKTIDSNSSSGGGSKSSTTSNAVSNVVDDLIRASAGAGAKDIADEDLDKYIADVILKEAREKRKKYDQVGIRAYEPSPSRANRPKLSTGFLLNVVRQTDSSNRAALRSNQEAHSRLRQERQSSSETCKHGNGSYDKERGSFRRKQRSTNRSPKRSASRSPSPSPSSRHKIRRRHKDDNFKDRDEPHRVRKDRMAYRSHSTSEGE